MEDKSAFSSGRRHGISQLPKEHINVAEKIIRGTSGLGAADGGQRTGNGCGGESGELHKNVAGRNTEQLSAGLRKRWWTTGAWSGQKEALKERETSAGAWCNVTAAADIAVLTEGASGVGFRWAEAGAGGGDVGCGVVEARRGSRTNGSATAGQ